MLALEQEISQLQAQQYILKFATVTSSGPLEAVHQMIGATFVPF